MQDILIAVHADKSCGLTPLMPFVGYKFDGAYFTEQCKLHLSAALLRCGLDVFDVDCTGASDGAELAMLANRKNADALITLSYSAFGSRRSFNGMHGAAIKYPLGRARTRSRILCEDICAFLTERDRTVTADEEHTGAGCAVANIFCGYLTCFEEAKLIYDPDFAAETAERIALGICEHFGVPYVRRDDIMSYPMLCRPRRGKKVKLLQCLLNVFGFGLITDGVYGSRTDEAVKRLCTNNGKKHDGVTADIWRDLLLCDLPELTFGSKNNAVLYVQRKLLSKLYPLKLTGTLDDKTLAALGSFLSDSAGEEIQLGKNDAVTADVYKLLTPIGGGRPRLF